MTNPMTFADHSSIVDAVDRAAPATRLLVVEDNPDLALAIATMLERSWRDPVEVKTVGTAAAADEAIRRERWSAVLLDLGLPDATGFDALNRLVDHHAGVPVVVLTGHDDEELAREALQRGAQDYIVKGTADAKELCRLVRHAVERQAFSDALRASQDSLLEREQMLAEAQRVAHVGSWSWDVRANTVSWSDELYRIYGYVPGTVAVTLDLFLERVHPDDRPRIERVIKAALEEKRPFATDERVIRPNGEVRVLSTRGEVITDAAGRPVRMTGTCQDVTEVRAADEALRHQAVHDPLTGLPNRLLFIDRLQQALARARGRERGVAVLFLDIDHFKVVNDSLGHDAGDELLCRVAERLRAVVRRQETVARFGGDEFTVIGEGIRSRDDAAALAERLAAALATPFTIGGRDVFVSASTGIAVADDESSSAESLLRDADAAMYQAKDRGRSRFELFDSTMRVRAMNRLETANALRRALERDELWLAFQPYVSLGDGSVDAVEALIRWTRPHIGVVGPADFIPIAEETGLIVTIGEWVLDAACGHLAAWDRHPSSTPMPERVWINLSARQLVEPTFVDRFVATVAAHGVDPRRLGVEITETALMQDAPAGAMALHALHDLGVGVAVDDFGTGYASLVYLRRFPVDVIKVDRSFVAGLGDDADDSVIVVAMANLAHDLGIAVVAEGVEDVERFNRLSSVEYDFGQGYYWTKPIPADELRQWLHLRRPRLTG